MGTLGTMPMGTVTTMPIGTRCKELGKPARGSVLPVCPCCTASSLGELREATAIHHCCTGAVRMLLERLQLLGDGSADAVRWRERAAAEEASAQRERRAQWVCLRQGQAIIRHGFGKLDLGVIASIQVVVYCCRSSPDPSHSNKCFTTEKWSSDQQLCCFCTILRCAAKSKLRQ